MTNEEFVRGVKRQTSDAAVEGTIHCLTEPPGRKPAEKLVKLSGWYKQLDGRDKRMLREALQEAAEMAVFEFFCVLDGVSVIEDSPDKGDLELYFTKGTKRNRLNDPYEEELHNLFNGFCGENVIPAEMNPQNKPYDSGEAQTLKSKMKSFDNLDLHHVPDKYLSLQNIEGYDPKTGSAMMLPKLEHRQIPPSR
jgi:hypothetical protein